MQGPFYIVWASHDDPQVTWIESEFSRLYQAEQSAGDIGGTIRTSQDEGMTELIDRWNRHDYSAEAHVGALAKIATITNELAGLVNGELREIGLIEAYADSDPACHAVFRLAAIITEAKMVLAEFVAPGHRAARRRLRHRAYELTLTRRIWLGVRGDREGLPDTRLRDPDP